MQVLTTGCEIGDYPLCEHPRPQMEREGWLSLNGKWELAVKGTDGTVAPCGEILVPFSPETQASGIGNGFRLKKGETLIYERTFWLQPDLLQGVTLLHFDAVDSVCKVFVNGQEAGGHIGGYTAFALDVTMLVREGKNEVRVECADETFSGLERGKQHDEPGWVWYSAQSGIWQSVWMESATACHVQKLSVQTDPKTNTVSIFCQTSMPCPQFLTVYDGETEIYSATFDGEARFLYPFEHWTPEHPKLYAFTVKADGDLVKSYFGVRSVGIVEDGKGKKRFALNGKPYFFNGLLDQGYWPESLMTIPSESELVRELERVKKMGFNTIRKHCKLESMRWYYHCDRLGIAVFQDVVNGGGEYQFSHIATLPFLGFCRKDGDYEYFARKDEWGRAQYERLLRETVEQLKNCTCIVLWTLFNEGWGQFDSASFTQKTLELDPSRLIDAASGWHDQGKDKTPIRSLHTYYTPLKVPKDERPVLLSEYGGYTLKVDGHSYDPDKLFGYKKFRSQKALERGICNLYRKKLLPLVAKGLCGCVYTQLTDVEQEENGLLTYDRRVEKVNLDLLALLNGEIMAKSAQIRAKDEQL